MPGSDGPFEVLEKIGPNAYNVDLPGDYGVSATFNVAVLSPCYEEDKGLQSLRSDSNQTGDYDGEHPIEPPNFSPSSPKESNNSKEAREVQAIVRSTLNQSNSSLVSSTGN